MTTKKKLLNKLRLRIKSWVLQNKQKKILKVIKILLKLMLNLDKIGVISQLKDRLLVRHRLIQNFNMLQWHQLIQFYHYPLVSKMINLKKKLILELELTEMSKENLSFSQLSKKHNLQLSMIQKLIWNMHQLRVMLVLTKLPEVFYLDGIIKMWIVVG